MKNTPKVTISFIDKDDRKLRLSRSLLRIKNFGNLRLIKRAKLGHFKSIHVKFIYGRDKKVEIVNEMDCSTYEDLSWAFEAFSDKLLWVSNTKEE